TRNYTLTYTGPTSSTGFSATDVPQIALGANGLLPAGVTINPTTLTAGQGSTTETLTFAGTNGGTVTLSYNGKAGTPATVLPFTAGQFPTAAQVQAHLNSIPELNGNVVVLGRPGGPFFVGFNGNLSGLIALALTETGTGGSFATITTPLPMTANVLGHAPTTSSPQPMTDEVQNLHFASFPAAGTAFTLA